MANTVPDPSRDASDRMFHRIVRHFLETSIKGKPAAPRRDDSGEKPRAAGTVSGRFGPG